MMKKATQPKSAALRYLRDQYIGNDPETLDALAEERLHSTIAQQVYDLRKEAGLTQTQLAKKVGTTGSVISRLEDADYEGHSLSMLRRIAASLNKRIEITFVDVALEEAPA